MNYNDNLFPSGFTFIEIIITIAIFMVLSVGGLLTYNSFMQNIDLERAQELVVNTLDDNQLVIFNGRATCSEMILEKGRPYFFVVEYNAPYCDGELLTENIDLDEQQRVLLFFQEHENELEIESYDVGGNKTFTSVSSEDTRAVIDISRSEKIELYVFDTENREETLHKIYVYFFSKNNIDPERVDHIVSESIIGVNASNQEIAGERLKITMAYPDAAKKFVVDDVWMKRGNVVLTKKMTTLDPTKVSLGDVFGVEQGLGSGILVEIK